jgi:SAM-dependent methyltransferase
LEPKEIPLKELLAAILLRHVHPDCAEIMKKDENLIGGLRLPSGLITQGKRSRRTLRVRNALVACSLDLTNKRVLDIGCADGLHAMYMAASAKEVWGIDHQASEIEKGRGTIAALGFKNIHLQFGDIRSPELFKNLQMFDLITAWGFLHRIGDVFSLLHNLAPITNAISLEWRTPVFPFMSFLSIAHHPPGHPSLDPMNLTVTSKMAENENPTKIEGDTAFWEPSPGAVKAIMRRLGFVHAKLLGYGEKLEPEKRVIFRRWYQHLRQNAGRVRFDSIPRDRVHMLFEKSGGSIRIKDLACGVDRLPTWDVALQNHVTKWHS